MVVSMLALPWFEGISSLPISGQHATPNRTPPGQSSQKSKPSRPSESHFSPATVEETAENTNPDDPNQNRIVPPRRSQDALGRRRFAGCPEWARGADFVTSFLYFFKPPFPSDGGCAAASAGRSGPSGPSAPQSDD